MDCCLVRVLRSPQHPAQRNPLGQLGWLQSNQPRAREDKNTPRFLRLTLFTLRARHAVFCRRFSLASAHHAIAKRTC